MGIAALKDGGILLCDTPEAVCKSGVVRAVFGGGIAIRLLRGLLPLQIFAWVIRPKPLPTV